jgi:hypothetical protein
MFQNKINKNRVDPYRHGVLIGNYVEDIYGQDLAKNYYSSKNSETNQWVSEAKSKFQWPNNNDPVVKSSESKLTTNVSMYDLNLNLKKPSENNQPNSSNDDDFKLSQKNTIQDYKKTFSVNKTASTETQRMLNKFHQKDCDGVFLTKKTGLVRDLFFGHGLNQNKFKDTEFSSTYK